MFKIDGVDLDFTDEALHCAAQLGIKKESGARGLRSILENAMMPYLYAVPGLENCSHLTITEEIIRRQGDLAQIDEIIQKTKAPEAPEAEPATVSQETPADETPKAADAPAELENQSKDDAPASAPEDQSKDDAPASALEKPADPTPEPPKKRGRKKKS